MFNGTVTFSANIRGHGLKFPLCEFNPGEAGVEKVEIIGWNGDKILSTVYITAAATREDGVALARKVNTAALNRIAFVHSRAIENAKITGGQLAGISTLTITGGVAQMVHGIPAATIKTELEQTSPPGEHYYGLLRSARQSMSPVEEFMHLYNILLMLCNKGLSKELQENVDNFIRSEEPAVQETPSPLFRGVNETLYTRLRNEFGHSRAGVNLDNTKMEMVTHLDGLITLTKRAIETHT